jgi:hypothetical protein
MDSVMEHYGICPGGLFMLVTDNSGVWFGVVRWRFVVFVPWGGEEVKKYLVLRASM